jgi:hypothetical protein
MDTVAIFCAIDDFCQWVEPWWEQRLREVMPKRRRRQGRLCLREVMTIRVGFHRSGYRTFNGCSTLGRFCFSNLLILLYQ